MASLIEGVAGEMCAEKSPSGKGTDLPDKIHFPEDPTSSPASMPSLEIQDMDGLMQLNQDLLELLDVKNTLRTPPPTINIAPLECHALQMEEIEVIRSIYGDDVTLLNDAGTCFNIKIKFLSDEIKDEDVIKLWFSLPSNYPCVPPVFEIEANQSGSFNYRDADDLFDLLMEECIKKAGQTVVFDLVTISQDRMPELVREKAELAARRKEEDKERQKQMEMDEYLASSKKGPLPSHLVDLFESSESASGGDAEEAEPEPESWYGDGIDRYGLKKPSFFIGSISEIIKKLPSCMQITRIENVMRQDLATRFHHAVKECSDALWKKARARPQLFGLEPQLAFHGTRAESLPSIVQQGLVIPGQSNKVQVRCGSSLGLGIYTSPYPDFSFNYSDCGRLVVCAVLLGQMYKQDSSAVHRSHYKYSSVISVGNNEWVLFHCAQVLPCYVIEVRYDYHGASSASVATPAVVDEHEEESEREKKKRLLSRAQKFLPYGFGPGQKTVILDAASFDDDEEEYGDYQMNRYEDVEADENDVAMVTTELQKYRFHDQDKNVTDDDIT